MWNVNVLQDKRLSMLDKLVHSLLTDGYTVKDIANMLNKEQSAIYRARKKLKVNGLSVSCDTKY